MRRSRPIFRDKFRGPGFNNADAGFVKWFDIHESIKREIRPEAYNAPNAIN